MSLPQLTLIERADLDDISFDGRDIVDGTLDAVIDILRRDPRFAAISRTEFELMFADVRGDDWCGQIRDVVTLNDVDEFCPIYDDDETEGAQ